MKIKRRLLVLFATFLLLSSCAERAQMTPETRETPEPTVTVQHTTPRPSVTASAVPEAPKAAATPKATPKTAPEPTPEAVCTPSETPIAETETEKETPEQYDEKWETPGAKTEPESEDESGIVDTQEYVEPTPIPEPTPAPTPEPTPEPTAEPIPESIMYDIYEAMELGNAEASSLGYAVDLSLTPENAGYSPPDMISGETLGYVGGQEWLNRSTIDGARYEAACAEGMGYPIEGTRGRSLVTYNAETDQYMIYFLYG